MARKSVYAMVVAAHPDDAEFGTAGTVSKWTQEGKEVVYVVCTNGDKGTSDLTIKPADLAVLREKEQSAAAKVLGVKEVVYLRHPDQSLEDTADFRKEIVREIRKFKPAIVLTSDPYRRYIWHRDHRISGQVTLDAIYPFARDILAYPDLAAEGLKPHKVKEVWCWGTDNPNRCVDITKVIDKKIEALRCHVSQVGENWDWVEGFVRQRCENSAKGEDFKYGESFHREEVWM